ncbi:MAG: hypothetical protein NWF05_08065 [Candidatus Bathyarchaeota archaeon]|nr:hypothetical protein [Candidatus Bathyarchaeota archaeon]
MKPTPLQIIEQVVNSSEIPLNPWAIHKEVNKFASIKPSTVRVYCRRLLERSKIYQPYKGYYCNKITHTLMKVPLKLHNVLFVLENQKWILESDKVEEVVGDSTLWVTFGFQRKKVTCQVACDVGLNLDACLFAVKRLLDIVEAKKGSMVEDVVLKTFEANRDYQGVRIDGAKCYTRKGLFDVIERIYQKDEHTVRVEQKVSKSMSVDDFVALIQGGVTSYNLTQGQFMLVKKIEQLIEAVKFSNGQMVGLKRRVDDMEKGNDGGC